MHTVALSFLPYAAGKQQLEGKMPKIGHFHFTNRSQRDNRSAVVIDESHNFRNRNDRYDENDQLVMTRYARLAPFIGVG